MYEVPSPAEIEVVDLSDGSGDEADVSISKPVFDLSDSEGEEVKVTFGKPVADRSEIKAEEKPLVELTDEDDEGSSKKGPVDEKAAAFTRDSIVSELSRLTEYAISHEKGPLRMLQVRSDLLPEVRTRFLAAQLDCELCAKTDESREAEKKIRIKFEDDYLDTVVLYEELMTCLGGGKATPTTPSKVDELSKLADQPKPADRPKPADPPKTAEPPKPVIPDLDLPKFSGELTKWASFKSAFLKMMRERMSAHDESSHMTCLKKALTGEAAKLIASLGSTSKDYKTAWDTLNKRYEDCNAVILAHLGKIFDDKMKTPTTPDDAIKLMNEISENVTAMKSLKDTKPGVDLYELALIYLFSDKLDPQTKKEWEEFMMKRNKPPKLDEFFAFIEEKYVSLELKGQKGDSGANKAAANSDKCVMCQAAHKLYKCPNYKSLTVKERLVLVKDKKLCSNCLSGSCKIQTCPLTSQCDVCDVRHHATLHVINFVAKGDAKRSFGRGTETQGKRARGSTSGASAFNQFPVLGAGIGSSYNPRQWKNPSLPPWSR